MHAQQKDQNTRKITSKVSKGKYFELEECLYAQIDASHRLSIALPPSDIMEKVGQLVAHISTSYDDFKASWFIEFCHH